ncbi:MAG: amidohydrolase family protein [Gemmatimonadaceae bacterium]|nr:amidohydrolase family protein [Gemmatimonadaceae bacterium]
MHPPEDSRYRLRYPIRVAVLAVWLAAAPAHGAAQAGRTASVRQSAVVTALVGATVIDVVSGERRRDQVVVVQGGTIRAVVPRATWRRPRGARVVSVMGKFVIPGLWDMHVEQALPLWDRAPVDSNAALFHPLFLAYGVTGVRDVAGSMAVVRGWRDAIARGEREGPRIIFTGPKVGMAAVAPGAPFPLATAADVEATVAALKEGGASAAYLLALDPDLFPALEASLARHRMPLEGNVPLSTSLRAQAGMGQRVVDHMDGILVASSTDEDAVRRTLQLVDTPTWWSRLAWRIGLLTRPEYPSALALEAFSEPRADSLFALLAARRVYQVPTLRLLAVLNRSGDSAVRLPPAPLALRPPRRPFNGWPGEPYPSDHALARTQARLQWSVGAMHRAGVPILAGSDTPNLYAAPGLSLHDELALLVRSGLTPLEALQSATWRVAEYLGATDSLGTVAPGRVADLVVLSADPTLDIANSRRIEMVMARGQLYDAARIDALRARATRSASEIETYWIRRAETAR